MLNNTKELAALLGKVKTIAVVGAVDKPGRPVDMVGRYLMDHGFTVIPVHPKRQNVWGLTTYSCLADIPVPVDVVDIFRRADFCPEHARETLALSPLPQCFWMQSGIVSEEASAILAETNILVIQNACIKIEHMQLGDNI